MLNKLKSKTPCSKCMPEIMLSKTFYTENMEKQSSIKSREKYEYNKNTVVYLHIRNLKINR